MHMQMCMCAGMTSNACGKKGAALREVAMLAQRHKRAVSGAVAVAEFSLAERKGNRALLSGPSSSSTTANVAPFSTA